MLDRYQLTDEVEREKELEVKALGEELAGELGLGERHRAAERLLMERSRRPRLLLTLGQFFFSV